MQCMYFEVGWSSGVDFVRVHSCCFLACPDLPLPTTCSSCVSHFGLGVTLQLELEGLNVFLGHHH